VKDDQLAQLVDVDADEVWRRLDAESGDLSDIVDIAYRVAEVDGEPTKKERASLSAIEDRCHRA
jgi:tellurite resistance protein